MKAIAKAVVIVGLAAAGVAGMYFHVEYAGWALFVGLLMAWSL